MLMTDLELDWIPFPAIIARNKVTSAESPVLPSLTIKQQQVWAEHKSHVAETQATCRRSTNSVDLARFEMSLRPVTLRAPETAKRTEN
jgi:hypothetical protein